MNTKEQIEAFLKGKGRKYENSKEALYVFEKENPTIKVSLIYFGRIFGKCDSRETKKEKVKEFLQAGKFPTCQAAYDAFKAGGGQAASVYFSRVYTEVRKETKTPKTVAPKTVTITGKSAREIVAIVDDLTKTKMRINLKNKKGIIKQASTILGEKGYVLA